MTATAPANASAASQQIAPCAACGFTLWIPVTQLRVSSVGLYDDARFPGRTILSLNDHHTDLVDIPVTVMASFLDDLRDLRSVVGTVTGAPRVNYAVLGNVEPHVHWHVVPRQPGQEPLPRNSPWQDPRPAHKLGAEQRTRLIHDLRRGLARIGEGR